MGKNKNGIARILATTWSEIYSCIHFDRYGTLFTQRKDDPVAIQSIYLLWYTRFGKDTDTHEILEQITGDFEKNEKKYQVVIDEEEE